MNVIEERWDKLYDIAKISEKESETLLDDKELTSKVDTVVKESDALFSSVDEKSSDATLLCDIPIDQLEGSEKVPSSARLCESSIAPELEATSLTFKSEAMNL